MIIFYQIQEDKAKHEVLYAHWLIAFPIVHVLGLMISWNRWYPIQYVLSSPKLELNPQEDEFQPVIEAYFLHMSTCTPLEMTISRFSHTHFGSFLNQAKAADNNVSLNRHNTCISMFVLNLSILRPNRIT